MGIWRWYEPPFGSPAASPREARGFASPPRGGFAFVVDVLRLLYAPQGRKKYVGVRIDRRRAEKFLPASTGAFGGGKPRAPSRGDHRNDLNLLSVARPPLLQLARGPWLCVPASRRVCLCRGHTHITANGWGRCVPGHTAPSTCTIKQYGALICHVADVVRSVWIRLSVSDSCPTGSRDEEFYRHQEGRKR